MPPYTFANPRRVLIIWAAFLVLGLAGLIALNVALQRVAQERRASDFRPHLYEADALMKRNDLTGALQEVRIAKNLAAGEPKVYKVSGDVYYHFGRFGRAIEEYGKSIALGSRQQGARTNTLWALVELKQYSSAIRFGEQALEEGWSSPLIPRYIAEACWRNEEFERAISFYEQTRDSVPNDLYVLERLKRVYEISGKLEEAAGVDARIRQIQSGIDAVQSSAP